MLYSKTEISPSGAVGMHEIAAGCLAYTPLTLMADSGILISLVHASPMRADLSLRAWVSIEPGGNPIIEHPINAVVWHPGRLGNSNVVLHAPGFEPPGGAIAAIEAQPGTYVLNILNLANLPNVFRLDLGSLS